MVGKKKVKDVQFFTEVMNDAAAVRALRDTAQRSCRAAHALACVVCRLHTHATELSSFRCARYSAVINCTTWAVRGAVHQRRHGGHELWAELSEAARASVQTADARRSAYDPDELEEEQRDRERQKRINSEFRKFTSKVQEHWDNDFARFKLEWEKPVRCAPRRPASPAGPARSTCACAHVDIIPCSR